MTTSKNTILRWPQVEAKTGLGRSYVHYLVSEGRFPSQIKLGPRASGWIESEIEEWIENKIKESRDSLAGSA